jgi:hypothetical protein
MLIALIVAAEIAFWLILLSGLVARYVLRRPRLGMGLLVATPLVDLFLLVATTIELRRGGEAALPHALAAVCIGVSVVLWTTVLAIDFLISFSYTVSPRRPNAA